MRRVRCRLVHATFRVRIKTYLKYPAAVQQLRRTSGRQRLAPVAYSPSKAQLGRHKRNRQVIHDSDVGEVDEEEDGQGPVSQIPAVQSKAPFGQTGEMVDASTSGKALQDVSSSGPNAEPQSQAKKGVTEGCSAGAAVDATREDTPASVSRPYESKRPRTDAAVQDGGVDVPVTCPQRHVKEAPGRLE